MDDSWHIIRVVPGREKEAEALLQRVPVLSSTCQVYVPRYTVRRFNRRMRVNHFSESVFYPGYLFLRTSDEVSLQRFLQAPSNAVLGLARRADRSPAVLRDTEVEALRAFQGSYVHPSMEQRVMGSASAFKDGELVTLKQGPLVGFDAVILRVISKRLVELEVNLFGRASKMRTRASFVKKKAA